MNHRSVRNGTPLPHDKPNLATALRGGGIQPLLYGYTDTSPDPRQYPPEDPVLTSYEQVMPGFMEAQEMRFDCNRAWEAYLHDAGYDFTGALRFTGHQARSPASPARYAAEHNDTAFSPTGCCRICLLVVMAGVRIDPHIRPHPPFVAPAPTTMLDPAAMPTAAPADTNLHPFDGPANIYRHVRDMVVGFPDLEENAQTTAMIRAIYMGLVAELDHHFGRIVSWLGNRAV